MTYAFLITVVTHGPSKRFNAYVLGSPVSVCPDWELGPEDIAQMTGYK